MSCLSYLFVALAAAAAVLLFRRRGRDRAVAAARRRSEWASLPRGTVVLHMYQRARTNPSPSPYPIKIETYLRAMGIKYEVDFDEPVNSQDKTPWITVDGVDVESRELVVQHLTDKFGKDMDAYLTDEQRAAAWATMLMIEEHLYWALVLDRWIFCDCRDIMSIFPPLSPGNDPRIAPEWFRRWALRRKGRTGFLRKATAAGMGRLTQWDIVELAKRDLRSLSDLLGEKAFLFGSRPCVADASLFGFLVCFLLYTPADSPSLIKKYLLEETPNLVDHHQRIKDRFWPDFEQCKYKD